MPLFLSHPWNWTRSNIAAVQVDDGPQIEISLLHGHIGDICGPDLIGPVNCQACPIRTPARPRRGNRASMR